MHNDQELPLASVTSSNYSSNSEHFIELKNFIINRVKHGKTKREIWDSDWFVVVVFLYFYLLNHFLDPSELIIDFKSLTIGKKIGSGHSGKVF